MKIKSICLFIVICAFAGNTHAQCDQWIVKIYFQLYGRAPTAAECNIRNYNNGSWNGYDQLKGFVRTYRGNDNGLEAKPSAQGNCSSSGYHGICQIAHFDNNDFSDKDHTCGQAAAVTALWHAGLNKTYKDPASLVKEFYKVAPPKITVPGVLEIKNNFGTDWRQMEYGLNAYAHQGIRYNWQKGVSALQNELRKGNPCVIMLDVGTLPQYNYLWGGGHWVVAYGYDNTSLYVTNFRGNGKMTWDQLRKAWGGVATEGHMAKAHGKAEMFMTVWKD